jgi:hypothetical protein
MKYFSLLCGKTKADLAGRYAAPDGAFRYFYRPTTKMPRLTAPRGELFDLARDR